jgi:O-methyltransferase
MMERTPIELYLDLIKKTLCYTLWPESNISYFAFNNSNNPIKYRLVSLASRIFKYAKLDLVKVRSIQPDEREEGRVFPRYADTMIGVKRLDNIQFCVETMIREGIEGDLIETGAWRGGACIFMCAILAAYGIDNRKVFVADSFEGLPKPNPDKYPADKGSRFYKTQYLVVSQEEVENNFKKYGLLNDNVVFLKGWFKDTLPNTPIEKLAILRLDGDMYSSTIESLRSLYHKLSIGGFCIIDDYALPSCRNAVTDFRTENKINSEIKAVDWTCVYFRKE